MQRGTIKRQPFCLGLMIKLGDAVLGLRGGHGGSGGARAYYLNTPWAPRFSEAMASPPSLPSASCGARSGARQRQHVHCKLTVGRLAGCRTACAAAATTSCASPQHSFRPLLLRSSGSAPRQSRALVPVPREQQAAAPQPAAPTPLIKVLGCEVVRRLKVQQ
jgi:hypothetical protein